MVSEVVATCCAVIAGRGNDLERELGPPAIDTPKAILKLMEASVDMGLAHSRISLYGPPMPK